MSAPRSLLLGLLVLILPTVACDPDLSVKKTPGDAAVPAPKPTGSSDAAAPPSDASTTTDGAPSTDGSTEDAGPTGHVIDGTNDFASGETFPTSSTGYTAYVAWDSKSVYFGMTGEDIGKPAGDQKLVLVYFGTGGSAGGTSTGIDYNGSGGSASQQPTLPFSSQYHVRIKTDLSYVNGQSWGGASWSDAAGLVPDCETKSQFVECRVARTGLGNPTTLAMHVSMVKETSGAEWTYAGVPQTSFTDGKDPNYSKYFEFNLADTSTPPNASPIK